MLVVHCWHTIIAGIDLFEGLMVVLADFTCFLDDSLP